MHSTAGFPDLSGTKVLVVDDEPGVRELLEVSLRFQGFDVTSAPDGMRALDIARTLRPDAFILDVMMPTMDGFSLLSRLRADGHRAPALFLTARDEVTDRVHGLELGADDYVTKPFSLEEVIARLRVILRRSGSILDLPEDEILQVADLEMDIQRHTVSRGGQPIDLSPTEFELLRYLMDNTGIVLSKAKILDNVWHYDFDGDGGVVESFISYLRRKVDATEPKLIHTVRGVGYVIREP